MKAIAKVGAVAGTPGLLTAAVAVAVISWVGWPRPLALFALALGATLLGFLFLTSAGGGVSMDTESGALPEGAEHPAVATTWIDGTSDLGRPLLPALGFYCFGVALGVGVAFAGVVAL